MFGLTFGSNWLAAVADLFILCPLKRAWEARKMNIPTENLNMRNYARCEWKCIYACIQALAVTPTLQARINALQRTAGRQLTWKWYSPYKINYEF